MSELRSDASNKCNNSDQSDFCFYSHTQFSPGDSTRKLGLALEFWFLMMKINSCFDLSLVMRKPAFCICENKDADQLRGNREADQRLCFRYIDSTINLLSKSEISSL